MQTAAGKDYKKGQPLAPDGPYLLSDSTGRMRMIQVDWKGRLKDTLFQALPDDFSFSVVSHKGHHRFQVRLHPYRRQAWKIQQSEKLMVISDPHGDLDCFVSILRAGGVMDENYHWSFGRNQLVVIGDVFDRGKDVLPIFWLIYKLELEAEEAGGCLSFLLGNHEEMVLRGDCRYTKDKYKRLADTLCLAYQQLWRENSELGGWLRTRNLIQIIGDNLFVHAGLSSDLLQRVDSVEEMNKVLGENLSLSREERMEVSPLSAFVFNTKVGPLWYRGMVRSADQYFPVEPQEVTALLEKFGVSRIIVGHTIFDDITTFYRRRVIAVNVDNEENREKDRGRGIVIENGGISVLYDSGKLVPIQ
ncbi:MAG: metallophosphoesterase [Odoribacter sp.]|nr:metallophosphoesterase [Odoribacter sp.]